MNKGISILVVTILFSCFLLMNLCSAKLYVKPAKQGIVRVKLFSLMPAVVTKSFDVGNFYEFPIDIEIQPIGDVSDLIGIAESSFTLKPNETKTVEYVLTIKEPGTYYGGILINVKPRGNIPTITYQSDLTVIATESITKPQLYVATTAAAIPLILLVYFKTRRSRR